MDTKMEIQITVSRTSRGVRTTASVTVTAEAEEQGLNPPWLADRLGTVALRQVDKRYNAVSKKCSDTQTETIEET